MRERYGDPPEPKKGYYSVEYCVTHTGMMRVCANDDDEAYQQVEKLLRDEFPDAYVVEAYDAQYEHDDWESENAA